VGSPALATSGRRVYELVGKQHTLVVDAGCSRAPGVHP